MCFCPQKPGYPTVPSVGGKLQLGSKADLLDCLNLESKQSTNTPAVNAKIFDGAAVVQMLNPGTEKLFRSMLTQLVFIPYLSNHLATAQRDDIVWDMYIKDSLKDSMREKEVEAFKGMCLLLLSFPRIGKTFFV